MQDRRRMSPLTAFFLGLFGLAGTIVVSATALAGYSLSVANHKLEAVVQLADNTLDGLPELLEALPEVAQKLLQDRRDPGYAAQLGVDVQVVEDSKGRVYPSLTVTNEGDEVVSLLAVRVALLNDDNAAVREWTEVVATPIAIGDWRGPIMPKAPRYLTLERCRAESLQHHGKLRPVYEITDVRIWSPAAATVASASHS